MKAFHKGFINGVRCCTIICASITGAMGVMYGLIERKVNRTKKAMEAILNHDYSMIVR